MIGCQGDGIDIGANGLVIRLNGHTISGTPGQTAPGGGCALYPGPCTVGINFQGHDGVTLIGGAGNTVANFQDGVVIGGDHDLVEGVLTTGAADEGVIISGDANRLLDSTQEHNPGDGVSVTPPVPIYGGQPAGGDNNTISRDEARGNGGDGIVLASPYAPDPYPYFTGGNSVSQSTSSGNGNAGISIRSQAGDTLSYNTLSANAGAGIDVAVESRGTKLIANVATGSQEGFNFDNCGDNYGDACDDSSFEATGNQALRNGVGFEVGYGQSGTFVGNRAGSNTGAGFSVDGGHVVLKDNIAGTTKCASGATGGNGVGIDLYNDTGFEGEFPFGLGVLTGNTACGNTGGSGSVPGDGINVYGGRSSSPIPPASQEGGILTSNIASFNAGDGIYIDETGELNPTSRHTTVRTGSRRTSTGTTPTAQHRVMVAATAQPTTRSGNVSV